MAVQATRRRRLSWLCLLALALSGCAGKPLAEREIVRGIFFARAGSGYQATLVLQDQQSEQADAFCTAAGQGQTAAQALADAAAGLDGTVFYGAMDLVGLPPGSGFDTVRSLAALVRQTAQPSPEVSLLVLDERTAASLPDEAGALYTAIGRSRQRYGVSCGIESVAAQPDTAALPVWQGGAYGFAVLARQAAPLWYSDPLAAQLAAVLCGQGDRLDVTDPARGYACQGGAAVRVQAAPAQLTVTLRLADVKLQPLAGEGTDPAALRQALTQDLQAAFAGLTADAQAAGADPYRFGFWAQCLLGPDAATPPAVLQVAFDSVSAA